MDYRDVIRSQYQAALEMLKGRHPSELGRQRQIVPGEITLPARSAGRVISPGTPQ